MKRKIKKNWKEKWKADKIEKNEEVEKTRTLKNSFFNLLLFQTSKPLMEKRRRERINKSLNDLKQILLEALRRDVSTNKFSKENYKFSTENYKFSKENYKFSKNTKNYKFSKNQNFQK